MNPWALILIKKDNPEPLNLEPLNRITDLPEGNHHALNSLLDFNLHFNCIASTGIGRIHDTWLGRSKMGYDPFCGEKTL